MRKLKRAVIKEELVALTGDAITAVILNQFLYWTERVKDVDRYIEEETERARQREETVNIEKTNGWIYKKSEELAEELMNIQSPRNIRRKINELVEAGYLEQRQNPKNNWDKTPQYRVNLHKIMRDLYELGYALEGYRLYYKLDEAMRSSVRQNDQSMRQNFQSNGQYVHSEGQNDQSDGLIDHSGGQHDYPNGLYDQAIPEITTETTLYNNNKHVAAVSEQIKNDLKEKIELVTGNTVIEETLISYLKRPNGEKELREAIKNFPAISRSILKTQDIPNPVGLLFYIAKHNIKPPKPMEAKKQVKPTSFDSFEQHEYEEGELDYLFENFDFD